MDVIMNQGPRRRQPVRAVQRFAPVSASTASQDHRDNFAGNTFKAEFEDAGFVYVVSNSARASSTGLEPILNAKRIVLLDAPTLEQQFLGSCGAGRRSITPPVSMTTTVTQRPEPWCMRPGSDVQRCGGDVNHAEHDGQPIRTPTRRDQAMVPPRQRSCSQEGHTMVKTRHGSKNTTTPEA